MAKIKIVIENDEGKTISKLKFLDLDLGNKTLYEIEREVEKFKQKMLPEIEKQLLLEAQKEFTKEEKKKD